MSYNIAWLHYFISILFFCFCSTPLSVSEEWIGFGAVHFGHFTYSFVVIAFVFHSGYYALSCCSCFIFFIFFIFFRHCVLLARFYLSQVAKLRMSYFLNSFFFQSILRSERWKLKELRAKFDNCHVFILTIKKWHFKSENDWAFIWEKFLLKKNASKECHLGQYLNVRFFFSHFFSVARIDSLQFICYNTLLCSFRLLSILTLNSHYRMCYLSHSGCNIQSRTTITSFKSEAVANCSQ